MCLDVDWHVGRHIGHWRLAEREKWTLAATLLKMKRTEGNVLM
jgi:hypothetical protein